MSELDPLSEPELTEEQFVARCRTIYRMGLATRAHFRILERDHPFLGPVNDAREAERPALAKLRTALVGHLLKVDWALQNEMPYMWVPELQEELKTYQAALDARVAAIYALKAQMDKEKRKG